MEENCNNRLWERVNSKSYHPAHVAEVGVWHPNTSNIYRYIVNGVRATLVEPDPRSIELIKESLNTANVTLHEVAVCDFDGEVELCKRESSTFVSDLASSPAIVNDGCVVADAEKFVARAKKFSDIDDGTIDLLAVDTEGSEWFVIKNMASRPTVMSLETHGGMYRNLYMAEMRAWLDSNGYRLWYKDQSDSVFVLDEIEITPRDRLVLFFVNMKLRLITIKKRASRRIKRTI